MLDHLHLEAFIQQHQVKAEIIHVDTPTPTVETAAQAVGVRPEQIIKTVLFIINGNQPVVAIACGLGQVDQRILAARYQVGRKRVKLADAETVLELTGYVAGSVPPFGHIQPLPTLLDRCILAYSEIYAGGGTRSALMRTTPDEIGRLTGGEWTDILRME